MLRFSVLLFAISLMPTSIALADESVLPRRIQASYVVSKNGTAFAKVQEQYVITGNAYKVESTTKGLGIYALLGVRKLTSTGTVTDQGLKPSHFELHQGRSSKKDLIADFDWLNSVLHMRVKGVVQAVVLSAGTQDLASYPYQFMFYPRPIKDSVTVTLTTGKKLNVYQYKISDVQERLNVASNQYKAIHLIPADQAKDQVETKELWLAPEHHYLMVKFLMVDEDGARLEQTLTELHVD